MSRIRSMFEVRPGMARPHPVRNGVIFLVIVGYLVVSMFTRHLLFFPHGGTTVKAVFARADNAQNGTVVRVHGVDVGTVTDVGLGPGGKGALVTMRVDKSKGFSLHQDARAAVLWRTLLGRNMYIDLDPGSPSAPPLHGTIPLSHTTNQQEFDELIQPYDGQGRHAVQVMLREFDKAFANPAAVHATAKAVAPAMTQVGPALQAFRGQRPGQDLVTLEKGLARTMGGLAHNESDLGGLVDNGNLALGVTAAHSADLGGLLDQAPGAEQNTRTTMARVRSTLNALDPLATSLRPGARELDSAARVAQPALDQARVVVNEAKPVFKALSPAFKRLQGAAQAGVPYIAQMTPVLERLNSNILPWLNTTDNSTRMKVYETIGPMLATIDSSAADFDANGHVQRFIDTGNENSIPGLPCQTALVNPDAQQKVNCNQILSTLGGLIGASSPSARKARLRAEAGK